MANKNEIKVKVDAKALAKHTLKITQNLNNFPKKFRFTIVDKLVSCTLNIVSYIENANTYSGELRKEYQTKAIIECENLKTYIEIAFDAIHPRCSMSYWTKMVEKVEQQLKSWRKSTK